MSQEWLFESACELGRGIGQGEIDPLRLTEIYLEAIDGHEYRDRIYSAVTHDRALAEAKAASDRAVAGQRLGLLDGVPISWKDLFDSAGTKTEAGTAYLKGRVPTKDAVVLANATKAGLVYLGKTHMSELAFSGLGYNPITATPPNVNDPEGAPGGSSSGAATSVAFGLAACGIGSDTGGSVRIPSAWNDLVGFKPTHNALSLEGVVPLSETFDTVGPLCRSVEDAAYMTAAMSGKKAADLTAASVKGHRFMILNTIAMDDLSEEPAEGFQNAVEMIKAAGGIVTEGEVSEVADAMPIAACLFTVDAYAHWQDVIEKQPDLMFKEILDRFRSGAVFSGLDYVKGWKRLRELRAGYAAKTAGYDAVIMPSSPILPPNVERLASDHDYYVSENLRTLRNTRIGNLMGLTAMTLPTGVPSCGIMLCGAAGQDSRLLRVGAGVEAALAE